MASKIEEVVQMLLDEETTPRDGRGRIKRISRNSISRIAERKRDASVEREPSCGTFLACPCRSSRLLRSEMHGDSHIVDSAPGEMGIQTSTSKLRRIDLLRLSGVPRDGVLPISGRALHFILEPLIQVSCVDDIDAEGVGRGCFSRIGAGPKYSHFAFGFRLRFGRGLVLWFRLGFGFGVRWWFFWMLLQHVVAAQRHQRQHDERRDSDRLDEGSPRPRT